MKSCCIIGHRKIETTKEFEERLLSLFEQLINEEGVSVFLFGSKSQFNSLCHSMVTELKKKYSHIKQIVYTCKNETGILEAEKEQWEGIYSAIYKEKVELDCFDEEIEFEGKYKSGRASYIERNQAMIDGSDMCIFYYDENYLPPERKESKRSTLTRQPQSGTKLAIKYAKQKKKPYIKMKCT